jgi:hypothetical protein
VGCGIEPLQRHVYKAVAVLDEVMWITEMCPKGLNERRIALASDPVIVS